MVYYTTLGAYGYASPVRYAAYASPVRTVYGGLGGYYGAYGLGAYTTGYYGLGTYAGLGGYYW